MSVDTRSDAHFDYPLHGASNPATTAEGTNPGSFALESRVLPRAEGARTFASPDTPGMPALSERTAWDFNPAPRQRGEVVTQLEQARLGVITPEMRKLAAREQHLQAEQVRDEVAAGRMIIPANLRHLFPSLLVRLPSASSSCSSLS